MVNRKTTNLDGVKAMARTLLYTDINKTAYSPMIVQHPFTNTGFTMVWDDGERVDWYIYKPTAYDYNLISDAVEDYISMYADQGYCFDSGIEMGGM